VGQTLTQIIITATDTDDGTPLLLLGITAADIIPATTPLSATLPLFAGGLGFVGYLTRRRKRVWAAA
jgi:hypothetical protein